MGEFKLEDSILRSWEGNVAPWIRAIEGSEIESRQLVTNQAIVDAVLARAPETVLDIGCGEGWLVRTLVRQGIDALGIDGVAAFIDHARSGPGRFRQCAYGALSGATVGERFDLLVCNFSLFGDASVRHIFGLAPQLLNPEGTLMIQTLHPESHGQGSREGWREGSWQGFSEDFRDPAPWYYRPRESWLELFQHSGFGPVSSLEPRHPVDGRPLSIIFSAGLG